MEKVVLDGNEYIKASVAAKQFKYTADYIGQLCRAKKVDARLVGRTWFVNPDSLTNHKSNKYSTIKSQDSENDEATDVPIIIKAVSPVLKSKTARSVINHSLPTEETRKLKVSYEQDEESLIPNINKHGGSTSPRTKSKVVSVKAFDGKKLRVKGGVVQNTTNYIADELPEVALSGTLSITPLAEAEEGDGSTTEVERENDINKVLSDKRDDELTEPTVIKVEKKEKKKARSNLNLSKKRQSEKKVSKEIRFAPTSIAHSQAKPVKISSAVLASPLIASLMAILCVGLIFSASSNATVTFDSYQGGVMLQVANLLEIFSR